MPYKNLKKGYDQNKHKERKYAKQTKRREMP